MVSGSAWCGRLTVTQEKGNTESDGFNSRRDRKLSVYKFLDCFGLQDLKGMAKTYVRLCS